MASLFSDAQGVRVVGSTKNDSDIHKSLINLFDLHKGVLILKALEAGPGIKMSLVAADDRVDDGRSVIRIETDGSTTGPIVNGGSWLSFTGVPESSDGNNDDFCFDPSTGTVYMKQNGSWNPIGYLTGTKGDKGDKGDDGLSGLDGPQGIAGPKGEQGEIGPKGDTGPVGATGPRGLQGEQGASVVPNQYGKIDEDKISSIESDAVDWNFLVVEFGDEREVNTVPSTISGDMSGHLIRFNSIDSTWIDLGPIVGVEGEQGPQGETGATGATGPTGPQGLQGNQGPQGIQGVPGLKGDKGDKGDTGQRGQDGVQGIQGDQGVPGIQGIEGPEGPMGAFLTPSEYGNLDEDTIVRIQSSGVQSFFLVNPNGDLRENKLTPSGITGDQQLHLVGYNPETGWSDYGQLTGAQGPRGVQGIQGIQGERGNNGMQGIQGIQGVKGDTGNTGEIGPQGPKGDKGDIGERGPAGVQAPYKTLITETLLTTNNKFLVASGLRVSDFDSVDIEFFNFSPSATNVTISFQTRQNGGTWSAPVQAADTQGSTTSVCHGIVTLRNIFRPCRVESSHQGSGTGYSLIFNTFPNQGVDEIRFFYSNVDNAPQIKTGAKLYVYGRG